MGMKYMENNLLKHEFETRFNNENRGKQINDLTPFEIEFPKGTVNLVEKYDNLERILNSEWHPHVTLGAAIKDGGLLTDHGVEHVESVMHHAYCILGPKIRFLCGYEIYLLLLSIHFHDLGNVTGREHHEEKIVEVFEKLGCSLELDNVERMWVNQIARAHGGYEGEDKDTIKHIDVDDTCKGIKVRAKVLAAILRFADEISDDLNRSKFNGVDIPKESQAYHLYSHFLEPVSISGETLKFHFHIPYEYTQARVGKGKEEVYIYDEIMERLGKCMREFDYCKRYAGEFLNLSTIDVCIDILQKYKVIDKITFRMGLFGYPDEKAFTLGHYIDKKYTVPTGDKIIKYSTGEELQEALCEVDYV